MTAVLAATQASTPGWVIPAVIAVCVVGFVLAVLLEWSTGR